MFTADEAFEFRGTHDAIIMTRPAVRKLLNQHSVSMDELIDDPEFSFTEDQENFDAGDVLAFLGY